MDACTRLARYVLMELFGWKGNGRAMLATGITLAGPLLLASLPPATLNGQTLPLWRVFWNLFGTSNQLLAALTLLGLTMWLLGRGRGAWFALGPAILMLTMTQWSIGTTLSAHWRRIQSSPDVAVVQHIEAGVALLLMGLALWLVVEAIILARGPRRIVAAASA